MDIEQILTEMSNLVSGADAESRSLTDTEVTAYEGLENDLKAARTTQEIRSRQNAWTAPSATSGIVTPDGKGDEVLDRAFDSYLRTGQVNMDLAELRAQSVGTDSAGGYLVPEGFRNRITERMVSFGGLANAAETIVTEGGNDLPWPTMDDTGNEAMIAAEGAAATNGADLLFGQSVLKAWKYTTNGAGNLPIRVSVELLQDAAFDVTALVSRKMGERIARKQAADFVAGAAAHTAEPQGLILGAGAADVALAVGNPITYAKLLELVHSVDPAYRQNASFLFNDNTLFNIRLLEDGNGRPLWQESTDGISGAPGGSLLGYPVLIDQAAPDGTGDLVSFAAFGDLREAYVIRRVRDVQVIVNPYSRANEGQVEFTAFARADGMVQNANAVATLATFDSV